MLMAARVDLTRLIEDTERELRYWGRACRNKSEALGIPTISGLAQCKRIAHIRAQTRKQKGVRREKLRAARKAWKTGDDHIDAKLIAIELGYYDPEETAKGKQKRTFIEPCLQLNNVAAQIDAIVSGLANWAQKCIRRSYQYGQADRLAANDLRMPVGDYTHRRRAAIEMVAAKLTERYSAAVEPRVRHSPRGL